METRAGGRRNKRRASSGRESRHGVIEYALVGSIFCEHLKWSLAGGSLSPTKADPSVQRNRGRTKDANVLPVQTSERSRERIGRNFRSATARSGCSEMCDWA